MTVTTTHFIQQLDLLRQNHLRVIPMSDFVEWILDVRPAPPAHSVVLTFDDGRRSDTGKAANIALLAFKAAAQVADVFADFGARFYVCDSLLSLVSAGIAPHCDDVAAGMYNARMSTGIEAVFCIFAVYVCCWGSKRFLPVSQAGMIQDELLELAKNHKADK